MDLKPYYQDLLFIPLGGSGEIGMNFNLYHYQGKWLIVDCGAGFADDYLPGVDMIVPDARFIHTIRDDIIGMVITHAHEDHQGAIPYVWEEIGCPIYTTPFTAAFIKAKLREMGITTAIPIHEIIPVINTPQYIDLAPFNIELVPLTHSTPEMHALVIRTPVGNVFHTGDWKFDHDPLIGNAADEAKLKAYGEEGILAMIGDSTNIFNPGHSGSEGDLKKSLVDLIAGADRLVAVTTFASNVARIETIIHAAKAAGRHVVLAGWSLWRIVQAAKDSGYLQDCPPLLRDDEMARIPREKLLLICTGCQGEPMAATSKIAEGRHHNIRMAPGDTIIFSSKIIPGNDKRIFRLFNQFAKLGVHVLTERDHFVHVSGHPAQEEIAKMYSLVRPEVAVPVHGEAVHLHAHAEFSKLHGARQSIVVENGSVVRLAKDNSALVGQVYAGYLAIDGNFLVPGDAPTLKMRRRMQKEGVVTLTLCLDRKQQLTADPVLFTPGILDVAEDSDLLTALSDAIAAEVEAFASTRGKQSLEERVAGLIKRTLKQEAGKNPPVLIQILTMG
jgi:ribonuclease J